MTPGIQLSNMTRLALVVALVLAAVLAVHFLTRHPGLQSKPLKLSLCCLAVLVLGSAGLYAIAQTGPDARRLEGFDALAGADGGSAASLLESIADMDSLPGAEPDAGAVSLRLDYDGGRLAGLELRAALAVEDGVWLRDYAAGADGTLSSGDAHGRGTPPPRCPSGTWPPRCAATRQSSCLTPPARSAWSWARR